MILPYQCIVSIVFFHCSYASWKSATARCSGYVCPSVIKKTKSEYDFVLVSFTNHIKSSCGGSVQFTQSFTVQCCSIVRCILTFDANTSHVFPTRPTSFNVSEVTEHIHSAYVIPLTDIVYRGV